MSRKRKSVHAAARARGPDPGVTVPAASAGRVVAVDAARGFALCLMFVYHFAFDLRFFGLIAADFENDPFWLGFRALIVALFMTLVGVSLVLADRNRATPAHFWRRIGVVGACALAVSAGSWIVFPRTYIYFGILHCIAVASILAIPIVSRPRTALVAGGIVIAAGLALSHAAFDARALSWIGFRTAKPATEDYVPLAPWAGFVGIGIALGHALVQRQLGPGGALAGGPRALRWLGRHSLAVYMVHQPILLGTLWLVSGR
jgi:uncharacterized membrane protein